MLSERMKAECLFVLDACTKSCSSCTHHGSVPRRRALNPKPYGCTRATAGIAMAAALRLQIWVLVWIPEKVPVHVAQPWARALHCPSCQPSLLKFPRPVHAIPNLRSCYPLGGHIDKQCAPSPCPRAIQRWGLLRAPAPTPPVLPLSGAADAGGHVGNRSAGAVVGGCGSLSQDPLLPIRQQAG